MKADVVIVGSGIAGLTAAAILSKKGKDVVIVEKHKHLGGSLRQFRRQKLAFDVGFHYTGCLGENEILDILWRYCDVQAKIPVIPISPKGYDRFEFPDLETPLCGYFSYSKLSAELSRHFPSEKSAIDTYFSAVKEYCSKVPFYNTDLPLIPFLRGYKARPSSLGHFLDNLTDNHHLRAVLTAPAFLYGVPIRQASFDVHALVSHGYYAGAYTVAGGGQTIVDSFVSTLLDNGVRFLSGRSVEKICCNENMLSAVKLADGEPIECDGVIYTGHPAQIVDMVPNHVFRPAYRSRLKGLMNSLSMFAVFGQSDKKLDTFNGPLNYYLLPSAGEVLARSSQTPHHLRPMMMTSTRSESDRTLNTDSNGIILLRPGYPKDVEQFEHSSQNRRPAEYEAYKIRIASEMIGIAEQKWGELCGKIEPLAVGTPLTFRDELAAPDGCAYGAMHCLDQFNPDVRTRLPGLFLGGQSTLMTGVVGSSISGLVAAGEILGLEEVWGEVKRCD